MKITLTPPGEGGLRELLLYRPEPDGLLTEQVIDRLTQHDLDDLGAVLSADKAMARTCPATTGEHTCGLPPGPHYAGIHVCRACPETWT